MKRNILLIFILITSLSGAYAQSGICDTAYWNHTYANERLKIYDSCVTITATVRVFLPPTLTGDGDYHIYVVPDSQYTWMINYRDSVYSRLCEGSDSQGYLICPTCLNIEEICKGAITDGGSDGAVENAACLNFNDTVYLPNIGEHVRATGPFIYDTVHCWNEMHPISKMEVINTSTAGISDLSSAFLDGLKVFPQPANQAINFQFGSAPHTVTLIKLYNVSGELLYVYALSETSLLSVNVSSWPAGDYLYSIVSQEHSKVLKNGKFSVVH